MKILSVVFAHCETDRPKMKIRSCLNTMTCAFAARAESMLQLLGLVHPVQKFLSKVEPESNNPITKKVEKDAASVCPLVRRDHS